MEKLDRSLRASLNVWAVLVGVVGLTMIVGRYAIPEPNGVRQIELFQLGVIALATIAVFVQRRAGLPDLVEAENSAAQRWMTSAAIGAGFAVADVIVFEIVLRHAPYTALPPFLQPFPYSLLLYTSGAVYVKTIYRLLPLTVGMLAAGWVLPPRGRQIAFVVLAIATSVIEPLEQLASSPLWLALYGSVAGFSFNLIQAFRYRKAGWLSGLAVRLGHYAVWHIGLGAYVQFVQLR